VPSLTAAKKHEVTLYFTFLVRICLVFLFFFLLNCELSYTRFFFFSSSVTQVLSRGHVRYMLLFFLQSGALLVSLCITL
jgi:flagellar biosynthesis protein FlhB